MTASRVLRAHDVGLRLLFAEVHGVQNLGFFDADLIGIEAGRRLHRRQRQELKEVTGHHVTKRTGCVVKAAAMLHAQGFCHCDLHMIDVISIPQRLEQTVGETQGHDVLYCFLSEIVVDAIGLGLGKNAQDFAIERLSRCEIASERLLDDDPPPLAGFFTYKPRCTQMAHDRRKV